MVTLIYLCILHFISDFILQSREMGTKKSEQVVWLLRHLIYIQMVFTFGLAPLLFTGLSGEKYLLFLVLNTIIHGIIDWNIWKLYKLSVLYRFINRDNFKYWEDHLFYTTIGFDQLLHISTLIFLWNFL